MRAAETTGGARPSGVRADRSRRQILAAARESFLDNGYAVGMDAIAARAGVSKVTVYAHFRSKAELFTAVVSDELDEALRDVLPTSAELLQGEDLRAGLIAVLRAFVVGSTSERVLALRNLVSGEMRRFPDLQPAWQQRGPARFFLFLETVLTSLADRGQLRLPDPRLAVLQLFGLTLYPHLVFSSEGTRVPPQLAEDLLVQGVEMFLRSYGVAPVQVAPAQVAPGE